MFILAAGMGSRYGGLKQLDGLGPGGETIMDYSVYDAMRAGFGKVVFVIRRDFEDEFRQKVLSRYEGHVPVEVVFQDGDALPEGFTKPEGRVKPWGTNHAVLMGADVIREPFGVINADDFYGADSFAVLADFLRSVKDGDGEYCMVGFNIENTLSENGGVSRGLCKVDQAGYLTDVVECHGIRRKGDGLVQTVGDEEVAFPSGASVSMNMWGFTPDYFDYSKRAFVEFLREHGQEFKSEFYIPSVVNDLISAGKVRLRVLPTRSRWFGVTYAADRDATVAKFKELTEKGEYPTPLFK